jgi:hypothetical protein
LPAGGRDRLLPDAIAAKFMERAGIDRLAALHQTIELVRRSGTISISGVYGGMIDPMPMLQLFDKGVTLRMGQANVHRWINDLLPLVNDENDPLGTLDLATHSVPLADAPDAYQMFQQKKDGRSKWFSSRRSIGKIRPTREQEEGEQHDADRLHDDVRAGRSEAVGT